MQESWEEEGERAKLQGQQWRREIFIEATSLGEEGGLI
jgi:hypothetical protein